MLKIVVDTKGADKGVQILVKGVFLALEKYPNVSYLLVGDEEYLKALCADYQISMDRVEILDAPEEITNYDNPAEAIFTKSNSSMMKAFEAMSKREDLFGFMTAGNTGALLVGAMRYLTKEPRVRPALAALLPTERGGFTCVVDTGATVDCTPSMLHHFAHLGREFMKEVYSIENARIGLLSKEAFRERGADVIVDGGQSMNPSAEDFIAAFDEVNADVIFVFPNNGNIVLTAQQAAHLYDKSDVRVIESTTIGAGYASLAMYDTNSDDADTIAAELTEAMSGVVTAEISHCVRDASIDGTDLHTGEYIGFVGKNLLAANDNRLTAVCETIDKIGFAGYDVCIVICGKEATDEEAEQIESFVHSHYKGKEVYIINGGQDVYDYILIVE